MQRHSEAFYRLKDGVKRAIAIGWARVPGVVCVCVFFCSGPLAPFFPGSSSSVARSESRLLPFGSPFFGGGFPYLHLLKVNNSHSKKKKVLSSMLE